MQDMSVAIIGTGEMGSAIAQRLLEGSCSVVTSIEGRSEASRARVRERGIPTVDSMSELVASAGIVVSILPPGQARAAAHAFASALLQAPRRMSYVDANAVAPATVREIEAIACASGADFIDAGIIGGPPRRGERGPIFFVSGPHAVRLLPLRDAGLDVREAGVSIGAASALKMSYAGITKGLTALCALMQSHARDNGLGAELDAVLQETRPDLWHFLESAVPGMYPKAYRWIAEMREIATYTAPDPAAGRIYEGIAQCYEAIVDTARMPAGETTAP